MIGIEMLICVKKGPGSGGMLSYDQTIIAQCGRHRSRAGELGDRIVTPAPKSIQPQNA